MSEGFQPYANVGTSFETPTTTELVNRLTGGEGLNDQLEPQKATSVEIGARGRVARAVTYSVTLFTAFIQDALIPFEVPSEPGRRFFRNAGSSRHTGGEVELTLGSYWGFTLTSAYTLADYTFVDFSTADDTFDDNSIPGVPRHHLFASLLYESPVGLWLAVDNTTASEVYADDANSATAPSWYVMNVRAGVDVRLGNWRLRPFAAVLNLLDESYVSSVTTNAGFGRYWDPAPPRNGYVGIEIGPGR
jgi:iron complex outermembrane receptor protein